MRRLFALSVAATLALVAAPFASRAALGSCPASDWSMYGHDPGHTFASADSCISTLNAGTLHLKWFVNTGNPVTASPSVVDGVAYVGDSSGTFYAIDATTGATKWTFNVADKTNNSYGKIISSAAVDTVNGKRIVVFAGGATLYALDAGGGDLLSSICVDPSPADCTSSGSVTEMESSPTIVHTTDGVRVVIGMDYNEERHVGPAGVLEFDLSPAWQLSARWKFDPETLQTYTGDPIHTGAGQGDSCGNVWSTPTIDVASNVIVFGIGNCDVANRPTDGESIDAITLDTGAFVWKFDPHNGAGLDLDIGSSAQLLPNGRVGEGGKDGTYYMLPLHPDTASPTPIHATHVCTPSDIGGIIGSPALGVANGRPAVFVTCAIYPSTRKSGTFTQDVEHQPGTFMRLHAINAETGAIIWDSPFTLPTYSAATYDNGVVYLTDTVGFSAQAYDANTGALLWNVPVNGAPSSAPTIVGDSIYFGAGTSANFDPIPTATLFGGLGGIWAYQAVTTP